MNINRTHILLPLFCFILIFISCNNENFPENTTPEQDYITLNGNGESQSLSLVKTGLLSVTLETITPDDHAQIYYYDRNENTVANDDIENLYRIFLTNHRLSFNIIFDSSSMTFEATESTYFESYYIRILFEYSSSTEVIEIRIEPGPPLILDGIKYDFSKAEISQTIEKKTIETFTNDTDQTVTFYYPPYENVTATAFFEPEEPWIDGLEYSADVPVFNGKDWSKTETQTIEMVFGDSMNYSPFNFNSNIGVSVEVSPQTSCEITCNITYETIRMPYNAVFERPGTGGKEYSRGNCEFKVPESYEVTIK